MNKHNSYTLNSDGKLSFAVKLLIALALFAGFILHILPEYDRSYNAALLDKVDRLTSIDEPKIVLIGNSNLPFGIDSKMLEEAEGMPVVNMGLHAACGNAFLEEMAKLNVVPGDIYIICHTEYDDDDTIPDEMAVWSSIENHFKLWKLLRPKDAETMWRSFPVYLKKSLTLYASGPQKEPSENLYSRSSFNEYGDIKIERPRCFYSFADGDVKAPTAGEAAVKRINELNDYLTSRGARLLIAGAPIANGPITAEAQDFIDFQEELEAGVDCPVISCFLDYMFDFKYFYDTSLHLNDYGTKLRTQQLISDLSRWAENGYNSDSTGSSYTDVAADVSLPHITDLGDYLDALIRAKDRYTVIISVKDDVSAELPYELSDKLHQLGVRADLKNGFRYSYIGIIVNGAAETEMFEHEMIVNEGPFDEDRMKYRIVSAGADRGNFSSIVLNEQEYSKNIRGLNFVVYSNETHRVLDEVAFETCIPELTCDR